MRYEGEALWKRTVLCLATRGMPTCDTEKRLGKCSGWPWRSSPAITSRARGQGQRCLLRPWRRATAPRRGAGALGHPTRTPRAPTSSRRGPRAAPPALWLRRSHSSSPRAPSAARSRVLSSATCGRNRQFQTPLQHPSPGTRLCARGRERPSSARPSRAAGCVHFRKSSANPKASTGLAPQPPALPSFLQNWPQQGVLPLPDAVGALPCTL